MNKSDFYLKILNLAMREIHSNEGFRLKMRELINLINYENGANSSILKDSIITYGIRAGVIAVLNNLEVNDIEDTNYDLFNDLISEMDVEIHNIKHMLSRPTTIN